MSEMMKNSDVEDVLFSIRRLVSDTPEETPEVDADANVKPKAEALMLTSALRVSDPATEPEQIDLEDMDTSLSHFRNAVGRDETEVDELPSLDDVFADKTDGDQPRRLHLSEIVTDDSVEPAKESFSGVEEYFEDEETGDLAARTWTGDPDVETLSEFATPEDTFGAPVEDTVVAPETDFAIAEDADAELVAEDWMEDAAADAVKVQEDEAVEEDESLAVEDSSEENALDDGEVELEELEAGATDGLADFEDNILDEDALRDMVTEIVREELSGDLGERITRNVRKLVRREIHRALMTRDFD